MSHVEPKSAYPNITAMPVITLKALAQSNWPPEKLRPFTSTPCINAPKIMPWQNAAPSDPK